MLCSVRLVVAQNRELLGVTQACDRANHVVLTFRGPFRKPVPASVQHDLAAALASQGIEVCRDPSSDREALSKVERRASMLARIVVTLERDDALRIEIDDALTKKHVARDVALQRSDDNAQALVIAVAVDELLRATWAELSFTSKYPERAAQYPEAREKNGGGFSFAYRLGVAPVVDVYWEASMFVGADAVVGMTIQPWFELAFAAGPRISPKKSIVLMSFPGQPGNANVRAQAIFGSWTAAFPALRLNHWTLGPEATFALGYAWFQGDAQDPKRNGSHDALVAQLSGGLFLRWEFGRAFLTAGTRLGAPLGALEVTDGVQRIGGLVGPVSSTRIGLGVSLP